MASSQPLGQAPTGIGQQQDSFSCWMTIQMPSGQKTTEVGLVMGRNVVKAFLLRYLTVRNDLHISP